MSLNNTKKYTIYSYIFAILLAEIVHWGIIEPSRVPTDSMATTILPGDFIFISKLNYGPRLPITLLQLPLVHESLFGLKSYSDIIQLPYFRLPGISEIKRFDIVVFNNISELNKPKDIRTNFVKRCIGLPGENIKMINNQIYINDEKIETMDYVVNKYAFTSLKQLNSTWFKNYNIYKYNNEGNTYYVSTNQKCINKIKKIWYISHVNTVEYSKQGLFISQFDKNATLSNFENILVPQKNLKIKINSQTLKQYGNTILYYDNNNNAKIVNDEELYIDNNKIDEYVFKQDYYFMLGDNRCDSSDSRDWGFVPEDHIIGKAMYMFISIDNNQESIYDKFRFDRFFKKLE